ncbi:MAG: hypothetical protein HYX53_12860 [Chloroflexi bacterium]|nr:hypothetical protein [Chloroflexota bacterium]
MGLPGGLDHLQVYQPDWIGVVELNIGDAWRARWTDAAELPANAPIFYAYALTFMGDKGYTTRPEGAPTWGIVEGPLANGEKPGAFVKRAAKEQVGATIARTELIGYLDCKATKFNPDFDPGEITVRPVYIAIAKKVDNLPEGSTYQRRRMPLNEFTVAVRKRYPEIVVYLEKAIDRYMVLRAKGEV